MLDYIRAHVKQAKTAPLAGNSIATDRGFIARDMPALDDYLHYRMIDVSSIKELCRRWYPRIYFGQPEKGLAHRALADIHESIRELQYYRRTAFVPPPGPSTSDIAAIAAELSPHAVRRRPNGFGRRAPERLVSTTPLRLRLGGDGGCSSVGRAPGCDPGCRGFESRQPPRRSEGVFALRLLGWGAGGAQRREPRRAPPPRLVPINIQPYAPTAARFARIAGS